MFGKCPYFQRRNSMFVISSHRVNLHNKEIVKYITINKLSPFMYVVFWCIVCHYTQGTFTRLRMIDESIYRMYLVFISFFGIVFRRVLIKSLYESKYKIRKLAVDNDTSVFENISYTNIYSNSSKLSRNLTECAATN